MQEFFILAQNILKTKTNSNIVDSLQDPQNPENIIFNVSQINFIINEHYKNHFLPSTSPNYMNDNTTQINQNPNQDITRSSLHCANTQKFEPLFSSRDIIQAAERISLNKAIAWDFIPDSILTTPKENEKFWNNLANIINWGMESTENFESLSTPKFIVLNKQKNSTPSLANLRPIVAAGPLRKIAESLILP